MKAIYHGHALCFLFALASCSPVSQERTNTAPKIVKPDQVACNAVSNPIWVVPNTHGTATGWLTGFSSERNYMINNYETFVEEAERSDLPFVFSEVPTMIAMDELTPQLTTRLAAQIETRNAAITNAFAVEYDPNYVTGVTTYRMGVMAQDWFEHRMGIRPNTAWYIDVLGVTPSFAESLDLLDIDLMVHERNAETKSSLYQLVAASEATVNVSAVKSYAQWRLAFREEGPLPETWRDQMLSDILPEVNHNPELPFLWLVGASDYSRSPEDVGRLQEMLEIVSISTGRPACFGTTLNFQESLNRVLQNEVALEKITTSGIFSFNAFLANLPQIKQQFRGLENKLITIEAAATATSLSSTNAYPSQLLNEAWWLNLLNADRALVWGAGSGDPFVGAKEWNVQDRATAAKGRLQTASGELGSGYSFDPISWKRTGPYQWISLNRQPRGATCEETLDASHAFCRGGMSAFSGSQLVPMEKNRPNRGKFSGIVQTEHYRIMIDENSGDITRIDSKITGKTVSGVSNRIYWSRDDAAKTAEMSRSDFLSPVSNRTNLGSTADLKANIQQFVGPLFRTVITTSKHSNGMIVKREMRFPINGDRIEFKTTTSGIPDNWILSSKFETVSEISSQLRGSSFGFDRDKPRAERSINSIRAGYDHGVLGLNESVGPAIRWSSHLDKEKQGVVLIDNGLLGREWGKDFADILLVNAQPDYRGKRNALLSGMGELSFNYALLPTKGENPSSFARASVEYNLQPIETGFTESGFEVSDSLAIESISRSADKIVVLGQNLADEPRRVALTIPWSHAHATLIGSGAQSDGQLPSRKRQGYKTYEFALNAQDAFILKLEANEPVAEPQILRTWTGLVPASKRGTLVFRDKNLVGHPPE